MPCMPALLNWIDDKPAGGWYAVQNIVDTDDPIDFPPSHEGNWEGVLIQTGQAFSNSYNNLRSITFSRLDPVLWDSESGTNDDQHYDYSLVSGRILGQGSQAFINDQILYNNDGEVTANIGMFIDYSGGTDAWMNQEKDRGAFTLSLIHI